MDDTDDDLAIRVGRFKIEPSDGLVRLKSDVYRLEPKVMRLFLVLVGSAGRTLSRQQIVEEVWDGDRVDADTIDQCVARLRQTLENDTANSVIIHTIPKVGYRLEESFDDFDVEGWDAGADGRESSGGPAIPVKALTAMFAVATVLIGGAVIGILTWTTGGFQSGPAPAPVTAEQQPQAAPPAAITQTASTATDTKVVGTSGTATPITALKGQEISPAYSPDGRRVAFAWQGETGINWDIYVKQMGSGAISRVTRHSGVDHSPRWSPDGKTLYFARIKDGACAIVSVSITGGREEPVTPCRNSSFVTLDLSPDGRLLAFRERASETGPYQIRLLVLADGRSTYLPAPEAEWPGDDEVAFSPDGRLLAFVRAQAIGTEDIYLYRLATGTVERVTQDNVKVHGLDWGRDSRSLYFSSNRGGAFHLWRADLNTGTLARMAAPGRDIGAVALSQDGTQIIYEDSRDQANIIRLKRDRRGRISQDTIISSPLFDWSPQVSPSGKRLAFISDRSGAPEIWAGTLDGKDLKQVTSVNGSHIYAPRWSPDGQRMVFAAPVDGQLDIFVSRVGSKDRARRLTDGQSINMAPSWSRDGNRIYFASNRDGGWRVWRMDIRGGTPKPVSPPGGFASQESKDGKWLYYTKKAEPGLWRTWIDGPGTEDKVVGDLEPQDWNAWVLRGDGVYFLQRGRQGEGKLIYQSVAGDSKGRRNVVAELPRLFADSGLAVAPDGNTFFVSQIERLDTDLRQFAAW